jgi:hypothetical protein
VRTALGALVAFLLAAALLHASPWWPWRVLCGPLADTTLCGRAGVFGVAWLHWQGDWVARQLRGTALSQVALLVWACGAFALLSLAQAAWSRLAR